MNPDELILKTGGIGALILLLHLRLNRMEARIDNIGDHLNIPRPKRKSSALLLMLMVCGCLLFSGCAVVSNHLIATDAEGTKRETITHIWTFWDASNAVDKLRVSNATKTQSLGASGISEASAGTNSLALVRDLTLMFQAIPR